MLVWFFLVLFYSYSFPKSYIQAIVNTDAACRGEHHDKTKWRRTGEPSACRAFDNAVLLAAW
jgi:hypothetical protein